MFRITLEAFYPRHTLFFPYVNGLHKINDRNISFSTSILRHLRQYKLVHIFQKGKWELVNKYSTYIISLIN